MNEVTISLALSLREAEAVCRFLTKADPLGVYTGGVVRRIDEEARIITAGAIKKSETEKAEKIVL